MLKVYHDIMYRLTTSGVDTPPVNGHVPKNHVVMVESHRRESQMLTTGRVPDKQLQEGGLAAAGTIPGTR